MDVMQLGTDLLNQKLGLSVDAATIKSALSGLMGDGQGNVDLAGLAGKMASSGDLSSVVSSWLGDGANAGISADSVLAMLGEANVSQFASKLGTDTGNAAEGLSAVIPEMVDKASSGGSLLDSVGGVGGLMGAAKSLFS